MSKQTITPGEWASQCQTYQDWIVYAKDPSYSVVCKILGGGFVDEKARANAQAIAAVPDTLRELLACRDMLKEFIGSKLRVTRTAIENRIAATDAALRKAGQID